MRNSWELLSGNEMINAYSDYNTPYPGGVYGHKMVIDSVSNNLYIYGGTGYTNSSFGIFWHFVLILGRLNDFWMYSLGTNTWKHILGNQTEDVLSDYNTPYHGSVVQHTLVLDSTDSYFYILGGSEPNGTINSI